MYRYFNNNLDNGFNDMMNMGTNISAWFIIYNIIRLLIVVGVIVFIARMFLKNSSNNQSSDRAIDILKERYAKGEIDEDEYIIKLNKLKED